MRHLAKLIKALVLLLLPSCMLHAQAMIKLEQKNGVYLIPCSVNGLGLKFIFDTGASDVSISLTEAMFMLKNGYLTESDFIGTEEYQVATGEIHEGYTLNIRSIQVGGKKLENVKASVVKSSVAPLLLGQSAISQLGAFQFDYANNVLVIMDGANSTNKVESEGSSKREGEYLRLGNEAFSKLKYSEAISLYDQAERDAGSGSETARKAIFNSALAYEAMGDGTMAMKRYRAALSAGYAASDIYRYIASLQSRKGELNGAINTIKEGRTKFPDDKDLMLDEMSYYLSADRSVEAEESVKSSIQKNPNSAVLWFVLASLYDKRAFETNDEIAMNEWYNKAEQAYKRSIELDPKFFDSNFNMGVLYNNRAAYEYEKCNVINKDALYTKCKREADEVYVKALPYFESAHDLRPDDKQVIGQLMKLYAKTGEQVKYEAMKRKQ